MRQNYKLLEAIASKLLEKESLDGDEIDKIIKKFRKRVRKSNKR